MVRLGIAKTNRGVRPPVNPRAVSRKTGEEPSFNNRPAGEAALLTERRAIALELRKGGCSYRAIAEALQVNVHTAYDDVQAELLELRQHTTDDAEAVKSIELERCDTMLQGLEAGIKAGDPQSVNAAIRVMERRARLLGLDAPEKHAFMGALVTAEQAATMSEADIQARVDALIAQATQMIAPPALEILDAEPETADE